MNKIQIYRLQPAPGQRAELLRALAQLAEALAAVPGSLGSESLEAWDESGPVLFIERWESDLAHAASSSALPSSLFTSIMQSVEGKPEILACKTASLSA